MDSFAKSIGYFVIIIFVLFIVYGVSKLHLEERDKRERKRYLYKAISMRILYFNNKNDKDLQKSIRQYMDALGLTFYCGLDLEDEDKYYAYFSQNSDGGTSFEFTTAYSKIDRSNLYYSITNGKLIENTKIKIEKIDGFEF